MTPLTEVSLLRKINNPHVFHLHGRIKSPVSSSTRTLPIVPPSELCSHRQWIPWKPCLKSMLTNRFALVGLGRGFLSAFGAWKDTLREANSLEERSHAVKGARQAGASRHTRGKLSRNLSEGLNGKRGGVLGLAAIQCKWIKC